MTITAAIIAVPVVVLVLAFGLVQTPPGKQMLAGAIEKLASSPGQQVRIRDVSGLVPFDVTIGHLEIADSKGVWLTADSVKLDWSPLAMFRDQLHVEQLSAAAVEITRPPVENEARQPDTEGAGSGLPELIDIDRMQVERLTLGSEIAGERAQWRITGAMRVAGLDRANQLTLKAERTDGAEGFLDLQASYQGAREYLDIKLSAKENAATLNRYSPLDASQGVEMQADISGPLDDLNGTLKIDVGNLLQVDGKVRAERRDDAVQATLSLTGRVGDLGDDPLLRALRGAWSLAANGSFDASTISIRQAELQSPLARLAGSGQINRRDDTGDLTFRASAASEAYKELLPNIAWQSLAAEGRLSGKLMQPAVTAKVDAEKIRIAEAMVGEATANLETAVQDNGVRTATVKADLNRIALPPTGDSTLTTQATITADLALPPSQPIQVREFQLTSPVLTAQGSGQYDPQANLPYGDLRLSAPDLSVFADAFNLAIDGKLDLSLQAAKSGSEQVALTLNGALQNGKLPQVPLALLQPQLDVSARGSLSAGEAWTLHSLQLQSGVGNIVAQGQGTGRLGQAQVEWSLNELGAVDPQLAGKTTGTIKLTNAADGLAIDLDGSLSDARIGVAEVPRLAVDLQAKRANGEITGTLSVDGRMQDAPIQGGGDFAVADDGRAVMRDFDLRWASISVVGNNFAIGPSGTTGDLKIQAGKLQQLNPFMPVQLAGSLDANLKSVEGNKVKLNGTARNFRLGDSVALDQAQIEGEITDPFGRAAFELAASASGSKLAGPLRQVNVKASGELADFAFDVDGTGENVRLTALGRASLAESQTTVTLQKMTTIYSGQQIVLASPTTIRIDGDMVKIERATLQAGSGTVTVAGTLGPNSDLQVEGRGLPVQLLQAFAPDLAVFGNASFTASVNGPISQPTLKAKIDADNLRLRTIRTAGIPPGLLNATVTVQRGEVSFEGRFSAGQGNTLNFSGSGPLPGAGGIDQGRLRLEGGFRLAQLTPFLGGNGRLDGRLTVDLTLTANNGNIGGDGTVRIVDSRYFNLDNGIALRDVDATFAVVGDRLEVRSFSAKPREGEVNLDGYIRIDPQLTLPIDLRIVARSARVLDRRNMQATISANLNLRGAVAQEMTLDGSVTVERALLDIGSNGNGGPEIVNLDVREINRPGGMPDKKARNDKPRKASLPGPVVRLSINVNAPGDIFVRGRGLDVELGGDLQIAGTLSEPRILGQLSLQQGTFSGAGRQLEFTRGTVSFPDPDRLQPVIDFTATAKIEGGTAEINISGTPDNPKVKLSSTPPLPQDEIMARLLFGRGRSQLSAVQMAEIASSIGTLSGLTGSGGGVFENVRKALGLDRLGVSSDPDADAAGSSPLGGSSLELGRNIAPGVYVGAKQGATSGSSTAVVEIEVTPNIKLESEVGTGARSKVGVAVEWDY